MEQIAQEGAIQIFKTYTRRKEEVIVGVVGTLQFDVLGTASRTEVQRGRSWRACYEYLQWIKTDDGEPVKEEDLILGTDVKLVEDYKGNQLLLFGSQWAIGWTEERNRTSPSTSSAAPILIKEKPPPACAGRFVTPVITAQGVAEGIPRPWPPA